MPEQKLSHQLEELASDGVSRYLHSISAKADALYSIHTSEQLDSLLLHTVNTLLLDIMEDADKANELLLSMEGRHD